MLDQSTRTAILRLSHEGHGARTIARALRVSRNTVREVLRQGSAEVPIIARAEKGESYRDDIRELYRACSGNLVRVHEELVARGASLSYQALTAFCRRHELGRPARKPAGHYHFEPGQEMQHDTSPHDVTLGGKRQRLQTASMVLCHSRMMFFQHYASFNRFACKLFLTDALRYFDGACATCMIDNTHVVVQTGTGADMVPVPEMAAFAERYGFRFRAHEKGHANRSARVERPFHFIENNFLVGREFRDIDHLNDEARRWCDKQNAAHKPRLHASPRELFAAERPYLRPLPIWVPEVYLLHQRIVDIDGQVHVHGNRYSVPYRLIGRSLEVRETKDEIQIFLGPRCVTTHRREKGPGRQRIWRREHRPPRGQGHTRREPFPEELYLRQVDEALGLYVDLIKKRRGRVAQRDLRTLQRMLQDYPREPLIAAVRAATHYGMVELDRLERMVLRNVAHEHFFLTPDVESSATGADPRRPRDDNDADQTGDDPEPEPEDPDE